MPLSTIFSLDFGAFPRVWYFLFFILSQPQSELVKVPWALKPTELLSASQVVERDIPFDWGGVGCQVIIRKTWPLTIMSNVWRACYTFCTLTTCFVNFGFFMIYGVQNWFFLFILKVANIRCFILIKCSEQKARFKKYA